ncbi:hypothetical protein BVX95_01445, partial [archaeon D22]
YNVKILDIKKLNHNILSIKIEKPKNFKFKAGQFAFISLKGFYARHPFTISNSPSEGFIEFTIKIEGKFTKALFKSEIGTILKLEGPHGTFTINDENKNMVFIGGGIGITPFKSLISKINKDSNVTLFYGVRKHEDLIFENEFNKSNIRKRFYVLSRELKDGYIKGYIDSHLIKKNVEDIQKSNYYICGPVTLKKSIIDFLLKEGVKKEKIHFEEFVW